MSPGVKLGIGMGLMIVGAVQLWADNEDRGVTFALGIAHWAVGLLTVITYL